jgi:hypothetical protein
MGQAVSTVLPGLPGLFEQPRLRQSLAAAGDQSTADLAEDRADVSGHAWHHSSRRYGHEPCHQSVLDQILTARFPPEVSGYEPLHFVFHRLFSFSWIACLYF